MEQINAQENQLDLLVNSAYGGLIAVTPHFGKSFWEKPISVFDASLNIGLRSAYVIFDDAIVELLFGPKPVEDGLLMTAQHLGDDRSR